MDNENPTSKIYTAIKLGIAAIGAAACIYIGSQIGNIKERAQTAEKKGYISLCEMIDRQPEFECKYKAKDRATLESEITKAYDPAKTTATIDSKVMNSNVDEPATKPQTPEYTAETEKQPKEITPSAYTAGTPEEKTGETAQEQIQAPAAQYTPEKTAEATDEPEKPLEAPAAQHKIPAMFTQDVPEQPYKTETAQHEYDGGTPEETTHQTDAEHHEELLKELLEMITKKKRQTAE